MDKSVFSVSCPGLGIRAATEFEKESIRRRVVMGSKLARERHKEWRPILSPYCVDGRRQFQARYGKPDDIEVSWRPNGVSYSCSFCGSMSVEEMVESMEAGHTFSFADGGSKIYIERYSHAGDCINEKVETNESGGTLHMHACSCRSSGSRPNGGPLKFYGWHLQDIPDEAERTALWNRLVIYTKMSQQAWMEQFHARVRSEVEISDDVQPG